MMTGVLLWSESVNEVHHDRSGWPSVGEIRATQDQWPVGRTQLHDFTTSMGGWLTREGLAVKSVSDFLTFASLSCCQVGVC